MVFSLPGAFTPICSSTHLPRYNELAPAFFANGVVRKMFIEPQKPGDPFEVSDADTMLAYCAPKAKKPDQVAIIGKGTEPQVFVNGNLIGGLEDLLRWGQKVA